MIFGSKNVSLSGFRDSDNPSVKQTIQSPVEFQLALAIAHLGQDTQGQGSLPFLISRTDPSARTTNGLQWPALASSTRFAEGIMRPTTVVTNIPRTIRSLRVAFNLVSASDGLAVAAKTNCIALRVCAIRREAEMPLPETSPIAKYVS